MERVTEIGLFLKFMKTLNQNSLDGLNLTVKYYFPKNFNKTSESCITRFKLRVLKATKNRDLLQLLTTNLG